MKKKTKKKLIVVALLLICVGGLMSAVVGMQYYYWRVCNFESKDAESHGYYIYEGASLDSVLTQIMDDYTMLSPWSWRWGVQYTSFNTPRPGYYYLPAKLSTRRLINVLQKGCESPIRLTWTNQIRTREQLAACLSRQLMLDSVDIVRRLDSTEYMQQFGLSRETAVCMFLPNTYEVYWTITPQHLFERMQKEYNRFWTEERIKKAEKIHLKKEEVATLASIVESETRLKDDYPLIASLYLNRIRKGMLLQACPTVIFSAGDFKMRRVLKRHLLIDSPYNTYKYRGLPPGPIRCANASTMDSVLNAPKTDYLYMCANPDFSGTHVFSSSYTVHSEVARRYQRELNNRKIK